VGERIEPKRDVLSWHNVVLTLFDAFMLASWLFIIIMAPLLMEVTDAASLTSSDSVLFSPQFILLTLIIQDGILVFFVWHQVIKGGALTLDDMGISRKALLGGGRALGLTAKGILVGMALAGLAMVVEYGQAAAGFSPGDAGVGPGRGDVVGYLLWLVSGCLIAPVSEEFYFRGYAFSAFKLRFGLLVGVAASAVFFAFIHLSAFSFLPILVAGTGLALTYHYTRSLVPCMVAHAVNNFIALTLAFTGLGG
jgi:hypothetical protein